MTPTPSLKDDSRVFVINALSKGKSIQQIARIPDETLNNLDIAIDQIIDLVTTRVLDLPEMQNEKIPERATPTYIGILVNQNKLRTQLTSAIKGLK